MEPGKPTPTMTQRGRADRLPLAMKMVVEVRLLTPSTRGYGLTAQAETAATAAKPTTSESVLTSQIKVRIRGIVSKRGAMMGWWLI